MLQDIYFYKGKIFLRFKQADSAIFYIKKSEPFFKDSSKKINQTSTYSLLSECYEQKGDLKSAIAYAKLAITHNEKLFSDNEKTKESIDQNYTLPKLQKRIDKLEKTLERTTKKKNGLVYFLANTDSIYCFGIFIF